jgi:L-amino acid N-acyltransferase YncA
MHFNIRMGAIMDLSVVGEMWRDAVVEDNPSANPNVDWWCDMSAENMARNRQYVMVVAEDEGSKIVGFADMKFELDPVASRIVLAVNQMYVRPEYRNRGLGWDILNTIMTMALSRGVSVVVAVTSSPGTWKKHGFHPVGHVIGIGVTEWVKRVKGSRRKQG